MNDGDRIRELRKSAQLSAKELANLLDVAPSFISAIEHNATKLSLNTLKRICVILNVSLAEFFQPDYSALEMQIISQIKTLNKEKQEALLILLTN